MAILNFDASKVDPSAPPDVIPSDKYTVVVSASQEKSTKSGNGTYLEIEFTVIDGEYRGRKVWDRLCLNHPSQQTVEIARANLSAICHAVGVMRPRDSSELHNIPLVINVKVKKDEAGDRIYNEVKGFSKRESAVAAPSPAPQSTDQTAAYSNEAIW
jgi:hypothetical protein